MFPTSAGEIRPRDFSEWKRGCVWNRRGKAAQKKKGKEGIAVADDLGGVRPMRSKKGGAAAGQSTIQDMTRGVAATLLLFTRKVFQDMTPDAEAGTPVMMKASRVVHIEGGEPERPGFCRCKKDGGRIAGHWRKKKKKKKKKKRKQAWSRAKGNFV